jgi:hypothetical protein
MDQEAGITTDQTEENGISLADMDAAIGKIREMEEKYKEAKKVSDALFEELSFAKQRVIEMLERSGRTVYIAEGLGRVKLTYEMSVQTPKTPEEKKSFFAWLADEMGQETADAYLSVNSQSLNSLYNDLSEQYARRGEVLQVPGLGAPIARTKLSVTKA